VPGFIDLGHDPEHVPGIDMDRARLLFIEQVVGTMGQEWDKVTVFSKLSGG
jgi:hypothetical protein